MTKEFSPKCIGAVCVKKEGKEEDEEEKEKKKKKKKGDLLFRVQFEFFKCFFDIDLSFMRSHSNIVDL